MFSGRETPRGLHSHRRVICVTEMLRAFLLAVIAKFETILRLGNEKQTYLRFLPIVGEVVEAEGAVGRVVLHLQGPGILVLVLGASGETMACVRRRLGARARVCACLPVSARVRIAPWIAGACPSTDGGPFVSVKGSSQPTRAVERLQKDTERGRASPHGEAGSGGWALLLTAGSLRSGKQALENRPRRHT